MSPSFSSFVFSSFLRYFLPTPDENITHRSVPISGPDIFISYDDASLPFSTCLDASPYQLRKANFKLFSINCSKFYLLSVPEPEFVTSVSVPLAQKGLREFASVSNKIVTYFSTFLVLFFLFFFSNRRRSRK